MSTAPPAVTTAVRALRVVGSLDHARLAAAVDTVGEAFTALGPPGGGAPSLPIADLRGRPGENGTGTGSADARAVEALRAERDRVPGPGEDRARFTLLVLDDDHHVLALTAHRDVLDVTSLHLVLGAVWQAYFARFRASQYRPRVPPPETGPELTGVRRTWWTRRLGELAASASDTHHDGPRRTLTERAVIGAAGWEALERAAGASGATAPIAVAGLVAWWLQGTGRRTDTGFGADLDLRDVLECGPVVGPWTERTVYALDLRDAGPVTLADLLVRVRSGFLDAVVRRVPHERVVGLADELGLIRRPRTAACWDVTVHFCRRPPTSSLSARTETAERLGLAFALFAEADLVGVPVEVPAEVWDGTTLDVRMAEDGDGLAVIAEFDGRRFPRTDVRDLLDGVLAAVDHVARAPDEPLPHPRSPHRTGANT